MFTSVQIPRCLSPVTFSPEYVDNHMAADNVQEKWGRIQHLFHPQQSGEALHHFLDILFPDTAFSGLPYNPDYSNEVNAFNRASEACRQLALLCEQKQEISRIFGVHDNTAQVMISLGGYELTRFTFDLSGGQALMGADFSGMDLSGANLSGQRLTGVNFRGAYLSEAVFVGAVLDGAIFDGAIFDEAYFDGAFFDGAFFDGAFFDGTVFDGTVLDGKVLSRMNLKYEGFF